MDHGRGSKPNGAFFTRDGEDQGKRIYDIVYRAPRGPYESPLSGATGIVFLVSGVSAGTFEISSQWTG